MEEKKDQFDPPDQTRNYVFLFLFIVNEISFKKNNNFRVFISIWTDFSSKLEDY